MLVKVFGAAVQGIDATIVTIEVNSSRGIKFFLVGLPDSAVKESHERIMSALQVNGYKFPSRQIIVNMAPADIRKEGSSYDLPLAIGILASAEIVKTDKLNKTERAASIEKISGDPLIRSGTPIIPFSSLKGEGKPELWRAIADYAELKL